MIFDSLATLRPGFSLDKERYCRMEFLFAATRGEKIMIL